MDKLKRVLEVVAHERAHALRYRGELRHGGRNDSRAHLWNSELKAIKGKLGLSKCKFAFAGAAPMTRETLSYFGSLGINVNEVYGMSECCGKF